MEQVIEQLLDFLAGDVFDSFGINPEQLPLNTADDVLSKVHRVKTEEFSTMLTAARRALEELKSAADLSNAVKEIDERTDDDSILDVREMLLAVGEKVESPFITQGTIGNDVQAEPCFFIGSREACARFRRDVPEEQAKFE